MRGYEAGGVETEIKSLDDVPSAARIAARQELLRTWYRPLAVGPFAVFIFISLKFFGDSPASPIWMVIIYCTLVWAMLVAGYTFFITFWGLRCPVCNWRFGIGDKCKSCGLPRHPVAESGNGLDLDQVD